MNTNFILKVKLDNGTQCLVSDYTHIMGGVDEIQRQAFLHLFPGGFCPIGFDDFLFDFAEIHGWDVEKTKS